MCWVERIEPAQGLHTVESIGDGTHRQMKPGRSRRSDTTTLEVRGKRLHERSRSTPRLTEWVEHRIDEVHERGLVTRENPVGKKVSGLHDRPLHVHPGRHGQPFTRLLIRAGDTVRTRVRTPDRDPPWRSVPEAAQFAMDDLS